MEKSDEETFVGYGCLVAFGVAAPASAADMPVKAAPPPPVAPIYNWTGFYIGAHVGGAWTDTDWFYACSASEPPDPAVRSGARRP